jgi:fido (protein-threonine AMPylation protein)
MGDFGAEDDIDSEVALQRIYERWTRVLNDITSIGDSIRDSAGDGESLSTMLRRLAKTTHAFLFDGILRNAGEYRKKEEPNEGAVYFGGREPQSCRMKYKGTHPNSIEEEVDEAFSLLVFEPNADKKVIVRRATIYYLLFVRVHPFYDANGRVGRMIVSVYLYMHGYYLDWEDINRKKGKFISKINSCHDRADSVNENMKEKYRGYLVNFVMRRVENHSEFYESDDEVDQN